LPLLSPLRRLRHYADAAITTPAPLIFTFSGAEHLRFSTPFHCRHHYGSAMPLLAAADIYAIVPLR